MSQQQDPQKPANPAGTPPAAPTPQQPSAPTANTVSLQPTRSAAAPPSSASQPPNYRQEDVLKHVKEAFAETIALKVKQLRRYIPKEKARTNTELTGNYIEELVRGFIQRWIGEQRLVTGAFYSKASETSTERPLQIDGIVHDPRRGPAVISEGNFEIVHPAFCSGVVEIRIATALKEFEQRLQYISGRYMHHVTAGRVMGVVIASPNPEKDSQQPWTGSKTPLLYDYRQVGWCPIFILFKDVDGEYEPHYPAIHAMIVAMHQLMATANYLR